MSHYTIVASYPSDYTIILYSTSANQFATSNPQRIVNLFEFCIDMVSIKRNAGDDIVMCFIKSKIKAISSDIIVYTNYSLIKLHQFKLEIFRSI